MSTIFWRYLRAYLAHRWWMVGLGLALALMVGLTAPRSGAGGLVWVMCLWSLVSAISAAGGTLTEWTVELLWPISRRRLYSGRLAAALVSYALTALPLALAGELAIRFDGVLLVVVLGGAILVVVFGWLGLDGPSEVDAEKGTAWSIFVRWDAHDKPRRVLLSRKGFPFGLMLMSVLGAATGRMVFGSCHRLLALEDGSVPLVAFAIALSIHFGRRRSRGGILNLLVSERMWRVEYHLRVGVLLLAAVLGAVGHAVRLYTNIGDADERDAAVEAVCGRAPAVREVSCPAAAYAAWTLNRFGVSGSKMADSSAELIDSAAIARAWSVDEPRFASASRRHASLLFFAVMIAALVFSGQGMRRAMLGGLLEHRPGVYWLLFGLIAVLGSFGEDLIDEASYPLHRIWTADLFAFVNAYYYPLLAVGVALVVALYIRNLRWFVKHGGS